MLRCLLPPLSVILMMGALSTSETSVYTSLHGAASYKIAILKEIICILLKKMRLQ
jgi:hypothetical protein